MYIAAVPGMIVGKIKGYLPGNMDPSLLIRITEPDIELEPAEGFTKIIELRFYDLDKPTDKYKRIFTKDDALIVKEAMNEQKWKMILVHCTAGVSRSPALALAIAEYYGEHSAVDRLSEYPFNRLVYRIMSETLEEV